MASSENTKRGEGERRLCAPRLACPKGGRAIRDISKKLVSNLVTGTGSLTVPITTSSERAGFDP